MPTNYPGAIDSFTNPTETDTLDDPPHADQHTDKNDAIEAVETELGINPRGSHADVRARLDSVEPLPVVRARGSSSGLQDFGTTEGVHATVTLNIPAGWNTYDVDIWVSGRTNMNGATGTADLTLRIRRTGTGGSIVQSAVEELSDASDETNETFSLIGFEEGRTATGAIVYVLTAQLSAQNTNYRAANKMIVAYAWRTS